VTTDNPNLNEILYLQVEEYLHYLNNRLM
jgi:hypothetical protein